MIPLSRAIISYLGAENFKYAVLEPPQAFRIKMGFDPNYENEHWIISAYKSKKDYTMFVKWFYEADIVLFSDRNLFKMAKERIKNNKLTFYFSERWWKPPIGKWRLFHPGFIYLAITLGRLSKNVNFHYLAQGANAAEDMRFIAKFENRIWNWGYFTDVTEHSIITKPIIKKENLRLNILYCGRLVKLKRIDTLVKAFSLVVKKNSQCHLTIIGDGSEKKKLQELASRLLPEEGYDFVSSQPPHIIREAMNCSDIFVLPSNGYEGWGAVINEAMAEGCAVIASIESGGGKSLISDMENGILFNSGNYHQLSDKINILVNDSELMNEFKIRGKQTVNHLWSPDIAADRFLKVCNAIIKKTVIPDYKLGPMNCYSKANHT